MVFVAVAVTRILLFPFSLQEVMETGLAAAFTVTGSVSIPHKVRHSSKIRIQPESLRMCERNEPYLLVFIKNNLLSVID